MLSRSKTFMVFSLALMVAGSGAFAVGLTQEELAKQVGAALTEFNAENPNAKQILDNAKGVLICPSMKKLGFVVGLERGTCVLRVGGETTGYFKTTSAKWGLIAGVEGHSLLMAFNDADALAKFQAQEGLMEQVMRDKRQYIDGVNNLSYWKGTSDESERTYIFHYYESKLTAMRMGQWKFHFSTKEDYYANVIPRTVPLVFNIRMDPYESYDSTDAYGHLMQKISWLIQPMGRLMGEHLQSLADYPPVQGGSSFDMSNVVEEFVNKAVQ